MNIAALILNYNDSKQSISCATDLNESCDESISIYIIDNGSIDDSVERIKESEFELVDTGDNMGFAGGMNAGIDTVLDDGADYIWLLNNDIMFPNNFNISNIIDTLRADDVGAVSPLIREPSGDIWFSHSELDWETVNARNLDTSINEVKETSHMPLAAAFIDAEVLREHPLPEGYFMYWEDVEWGVRVRDAGYRLVTTPSAEVIHDAGSSSNQALKSYYSARNRWIFYRRFNERCESFYIPYVTLMGKLAIGRVLDRDPEAILAILEGIIDGVRGQTGKGRYP